MVGGEMPLLRPDAVVLIERPDELVKVPTPEPPPPATITITKHTRKHAENTQKTNTQASARTRDTMKPYDLNDVFLSMVWNIMKTDRSDQKAKQK